MSRRSPATRPSSSTPGQVTNHHGRRRRAARRDRAPDLVELDTVGHRRSRARPWTTTSWPRSTSSAPAGRCPPWPRLTPAGNPGAPSYDRAFGTWRTSGIGSSRVPKLSLPNVSLANTSSLARPWHRDGQRLQGRVRLHPDRAGRQSPFSGANNYDWLLNHDVPGILANRFELGDFTTRRICC